MSVAKELKMRKSILNCIKTVSCLLALQWLLALQSISSHFFLVYPRVPNYRCLKLTFASCTSEGWHWHTVLVWGATFFFQLGDGTQRAPQGSYSVAIVTFYLPMVEGSPCRNDVSEPCKDPSPILLVILGYRNRLTANRLLLKFKLQ